MNTAPASLLYTDFQGIAELKAKAHADAKGSLDQVARQFESLFTQMMLKSMRKAKLAEGIMDNDQTKFYQEMYDQQLAIHLSESGGIGLTDVIKSQLGGTEAANDSKPVNSDIPEPVSDLNSPFISNNVSKLQSLFGVAPEEQTETEQQSQQVTTTDPKSWKKSDFVQQLWPWAREAAERLGLAPAALLAQAALETGWGKHIMPSGNGESARNLFGIKTGRRWKGGSVNIGTLEYEQGVAVRKKDRFRAYDTFRDSINDYVDFLQSNPRYSKALASTSDSREYFRELQRAGYATDPHYAEKLTRVLESKDMRKALQQLKESGEASL
ncbi:MAG: flagellar assembly peptidoglycan hydrolase FlgJ [Gammaproteobacteria bacterium]